MSCHREQSVSVNVEGEKGIIYSFYFNDSFVFPGECVAYGVQQYNCHMYTVSMSFVCLIMP